MSEKEKAHELVAKTFQIVAKAVGHKGIKTAADTHIFAKIEKLSKSLAKMQVDEILTLNSYLLPVEKWSNNCDYWLNVKKEIELL